MAMAVNSAVLHFNEGTSGVFDILNEFGIQSGKVAVAKSKKHDTVRIRSMNHKSSEPVQKRRKKLKTIKKGLLDAENEVEEPAYVKGRF